MEEHSRPAALSSGPRQHSAQRQCGGVITSGLSGAVRRAVTSAGFTEMGTTQQVYRGAQKKRKTKINAGLSFIAFYLVAAVYLVPVSFFSLNI